MNLIEYTGPRQQTDASVAILFVHGLLGDSDDWINVVNHLSIKTQARCFGVDLPGHGKAILSDSSELSFDRLSAQLRQHCQHLIDAGTEELHLVGYSLGARLLMYALTRHYVDFPQLKSIVIEGGNFGLEDKVLISERAQNDEMWAQRFEAMPAEQALDLWYQQPVFSDLNEHQRQDLIAVRKHNDFAAVAEMLRATSLAKQPNLLPDLRSCQMQIKLLVGENDIKFRTLYKHTGIPTTIVPNAGHNTHKDNPHFVARTLAKWLYKYSD